MEVFNIEFLQSSNIKKYLFILLMLIIIIALFYISIIRTVKYYNKTCSKGLTFSFSNNKKDNDKKDNTNLISPNPSLPPPNINYKSNTTPDPIFSTNNSNSKITTSKCDNDSKEIKNKDKKEVFNISENIYTFNEASDLCKIFNSELATYEQLENEFKKGADWCNYGWTANQTAYYPTQYSSWQKLQNTSTPDQCGKVGVNGGYFQNPELKFGVNCYGIKPKSTKCNTDKRNVDAGKSPEQLEREENIRRMEQNKKNILILPFNNNAWSEKEVKSENFINN